MKKLKTYKVSIDTSLESESGVSVISLVDEPAIQINWVALNKEKMVDFEFKANKDKQILTGPFLIPNFPILRSNEINGVKEYFNIIFETEVIASIANKFNKSNNNTMISKDHNGEIINSAYLGENWIIEDSKADKSSLYGFELPVGTWFGSIHIEDENFWNEYVKTGKVNGFSVEAGLFLEETFKTIMEKEYITKEQIQINMEKAKLIDGTEVQVSELAVGGSVEVYTPEGQWVPAPDAEHTLENGVKITTVGGVITEIKQVEVVAEEIAEPKHLALTLTPEDLMLFSDLINTALQDVITALTDLNNRVTALESKDVVESTDVQSVMNAELKAEIEMLKDKFNKTPAVSTKFNKTDEPTRKKIDTVEEQLEILKKFKR